MKSKAELNPELVISSEGELAKHRRNRVTPPFTTEELRKIETFSYLWYKFLQDNQLSTRKLIDSIDDLHSVTLKVKDLTDEGLLFYQKAERFLNLNDFNVDPEKRVQRILVKELRSLRPD